MPKTKDDAEPLVGNQPARVDNPFVPGAAYEAAPPPSAATVIKMWAGGEHARALDLFNTLKLSDADKASVIANCPGWSELTNQ